MHRIARAAFRLEGGSDTLKRSHDFRVKAEVTRKSKPARPNAESARTYASSQRRASSRATSRNVTPRAISTTT